MNQNFEYLTILYTILINVVSSFIFLFLLLRFLKPNFEIVDFVAKNKNPFDEHDYICYAFKVINKSFFGVYDISATANSCKIKRGDNKIINKIYTSIELKTSKINYISRRPLFDRTYGDNCVQFFTYEDLSSKIMEGCYIEFQITAKHSLTGLNAFFTHDFTQSSIKIGEFKEGNYKKIK